MKPNSSRTAHLPVNDGGPAPTETHIRQGPGDIFRQTGPNAARIYDYLLGKDNYDADR
jgi:hypothetical protein